MTKLWFPASRLGSASASPSWPLEAGDDGNSIPNKREREAPFFISESLVQHMCTSKLILPQPTVMLLSCADGECRAYEHGGIWKEHNSDRHKKGNTSRVPIMLRAYAKYMWSYFLNLFQTFWRFSFGSMACPSTTRLLWRVHLSQDLSTYSSEMFIEAGCACPRS